MNEPLQHMTYLHAATTAIDEHSTSKIKPWTSSGLPRQPVELMN